MKLKIEKERRKKMDIKRIFVKRLMITLGDSYFDITIKERLLLLKAIIPIKPEPKDYKYEELEGLA